MATTGAIGQLKFRDEAQASKASTPRLQGSAQRSGAIPHIALRRLPVPRLTRRPLLFSLSPCQRESRLAVPCPLTDIGKPPKKNCPQQVGICTIAVRALASVAARCIRTDSALDARSRYGGSLRRTAAAKYTALGMCSAYQEIFAAAYPAPGRSPIRAGLCQLSGEGGRVNASQLSVQRCNSSKKTSGSGPTSWQIAPDGILDSPH
ncbi:hypothetical protein VTI28DRAFT_1073 [Corynascus sepedonium]